jgi:hypothetical protein
MRTVRIPVHNARWLPTTPPALAPPRRVRSFIAGLALGVLLGWATSPAAARAAESYGSQLERIARAAESIARTLDKAAR